MAVIFAQTKAREFHLDHITFLMYFLEVACAVEESEDWSLRSFFVDIPELLLSSAFVKIRHFSTVFNVAAHSLAKACFDSHKNAEFFYSFPEELGRQSG